MKQIKSGIFFILVVGFTLIVSCGPNNTQLLSKTWRMEEDSTVVFELKSDSSFISFEGDKIIKGSWSLTNDEKWLVLKNIDERQPQILEIKSLNRDRLVISNNGDHMVFIVSK